MKTCLWVNDRTNTGPGSRMRSGPEQSGLLASKAEESRDIWMALHGNSLDPAGLMSSASGLADDSAVLHFCTVLPGTLESKLCSDTSLG